MLAQVPAFQREGARDGRSSQAFPSAIPGMPLGLAGEQELACGGEDLLFQTLLFFKDPLLRRNRNSGRRGCWKSWEVQRCRWRQRRQKVKTNLKDQEGELKEFKH